jgi:hypothetical protein
MLSRTLVLATLVAALVLGGCASSGADNAEPTGDTSSDMLASGSYQPRMRQTIRLLRAASSALATSTPDSAALAIIASAVEQVRQGIVYDATHISAKEGQRLDSAADVAAATSIQQCAEDVTTQVSCLLEAAVARLKAATWDKGGFRQEAMATIGQAEDAL